MRKGVQGRVEMEERKNGTGREMSRELEGRRKKSVGRSMRRVKSTIGRKM